MTDKEKHLAWKDVRERSRMILTVPMFVRHCVKHSSSSCSVSGPICKTKVRHN